MNGLHRWLGVGLLAGSLAIGVQSAPAAAAARAGAQGKIDPARVLQLVNAERVASGRPSLVPNDALERSARQQAEEMAEGNFVAHRSRAGAEMVARGEAAGYRTWTFLGETLAAGQPTAEAVVAEWMTSPADRANLLSDQATEIGVGYAFSPTSRYRDYWAVAVGRSASAARPAGADGGIRTPDPLFTKELLYP